MINNSLAAVHGYLCSDGYVIKNPPHQKHKYYHIGLRNKNMTLLRDFQENFGNVFGKKPRITNEKERCKIQDKEIYQRLTAQFGSFYSRDWTLPEMGRKSAQKWLRAYFDCDGWVRVLKGKDRKIGLESINERGIKEIQRLLRQEFSIDSSIASKRGRNIYALHICGKNNILKFKEAIGFLHPQKARKLDDALQSYMDYRWVIPQSISSLKQFLLQKGRERKSRNELRFFSILKNNLLLLKASLEKYNIHPTIFGPWKNNWDREYYCLIMKKDDIHKIGGKNGFPTTRVRET